MVRTSDGHEIHLTTKEADMLAILVKHMGRVVSYQTIVAGLWPITSDLPENPHNLIQIHKMHLKHKLDGTGLVLETDWGHGIRVTGELTTDWTVR